jgi:hypothetical protein
VTISWRTHILLSKNDSHEYLRIFFRGLSESQQQKIKNKEAVKLGHLLAGSKLCICNNFVTIEAVKTRCSNEEGTESHYVYWRLEGSCESDSYAACKRKGRSARQTL